MYRFSDLLIPSILNTDALSHHNEYPENFLHTAKKEKKNKYLESCLWKCLQFSPFAGFMEGLFGVQAEAKLKQVASRLATKWKHPYSCMCRYVKSGVTITLVI